MALDRNRPLVYLLREALEPDPYEEALTGRGFRAQSIPVLSFRFVHGEELGGALSHPERYGGLILTSPRATEALEESLAAVEGGAVSWQSKPIFAVGPATAGRLHTLGFTVQGEHSGNAEALADVIVANRTDRPLLFLCGNRSLDVLPKHLTQAGVPFERLRVYETHLRPGLDFSSSDSPDWIVFFSPSGVEAAQGAAGIGGPNTRIAAIGETTARALSDAGMRLDAVSATPAPEALADALAESRG